MNLKEAVDEWVKKIGIDQLKPYDTGEISWALNIGKELNSLEAADVDAAMIILSNYRLMLSYQMGMCFARLKYLEANGPKSSLDAERAKMNIIKPWHDGVEAKIAVLKKLHERKVREIECYKR